MEESIKSPYHNSQEPLLTKEKLDQVKKILGVDCVFIAVQKEICENPECSGHTVELASTNFPNQALLKIAEAVVDRVDDSEKDNNK